MSGATQVSERPLTVFEKIWLPHVVDSLDDGPDLLAIDLHLAHEVTSQDAFRQIESRGLPVAHPEKTLAVVDHVVPTGTDGETRWTPRATEFATDLAANCARHGIPLLPWHHRSQGIVHVIGPELGLTLPGTTLVCGDSHTSTHGGLGAIAFGIGTTQVAHVLANQALLVDRPRTMSVTIDGPIPEGVTAKDIALALIGTYGNQGGAGCAVEFRGSAVTELSVEGRMTLCNMGVEFGSRLCLIAPDDRTVDYLHRRPYAPQGSDWDIAVAAWSQLRTDEGAHFDVELTLDATAISPSVTWGTNPAQVIQLGQRVPDPATLDDPEAADTARRALEYMQLTPGTDLRDVPIDAAFIGSCTNGRLEDLRAAAQVLAGRHVAPGVRAIAVPGSMTVKRAAEAEGLDGIFRAAGFQWGDAGCSLCIAANGDLFAPGTRAASSTNRNFEGRQGTGSRTHLMSPASVAASAVTGHLASPADLEESTR